MRQNVYISLKSWLYIANVLKKSCDKMSTVHFAKQPAGHHKWAKNHVTNCPNFASGKKGHDVTEHSEEGGRHATCDKPSTSKLGWTKNTWMDHAGVRMSQ